jgi:lipopolysaccharide/colanic/teichoic acid biosynthesis glycosyltransferase
MAPPLWYGGTAIDVQESSVVKRTVDISVAALGLVGLAPVLLLIALLVVLDSPGPVFYRAERVGFRGRRLQMLKFRKMHADARGNALTLAADERFTRLGKWLARTKLDELPQLWHVLRGEMSLVGPRPESPAFVARFPHEYAHILRVRPGITGYTQLAFAREASILDPGDPQGHYLTAVLPQKMALDRLYAARPGMRRDIKILIATALTLAGQPIAVDRATGALTLRRRAPESDHHSGSNATHTGATVAGAAAPGLEATGARAPHRRSG